MGMGYTAKSLLIVYMYEFKCFIDMDHISQPRDSNWCWVACLVKLLNGLGIQTLSESDQCQFATEYFRNYHSVDTANCCETNGAQKVCYKGIEPDDLVKYYGDKGIICKRIKDRNEIFDYEFVKEQLIANDAPILLKTKHGDGFHLELITGYGYKDECQYVLVGNPLKNVGEFYLPMEVFEQRHSWKLLEAWICKPDSKEIRRKSLVQDDKLDAILSNLRESLEEKSEEYPFLKHLRSEDLLELLGGHKGELAFLIKLDEKCHMPIPRQLYPVTEIEDPDKIEIEDQENSQVFFTTYGTLVGFKENKWYVQTAPKNYELKDSWSSLKALGQELKKKPKINFFN